MSLHTIVRFSSFRLSQSIHNHSPTRLFATATNCDRIDLLHNFLKDRHDIVASSLDPNNVKDVGESALKAYNTYINPSQPKLETFLSHPPHMLSQAAERTSNQIAHLVDRHKARESQVLRNSDDEDLEKTNLVKVRTEVSAVESSLCKLL